MVPLTLIQWPHVFRGRRTVWYVDNTSAMAAFVKGASRSLELERIVNLFWVLAYHLECVVWFEWVDSRSSWADGVSRRLGSDPFAARHGFALQEMEQPRASWTGDIHEISVQAVRRAKKHSFGVRMVSARTM